MVIFWQDCLWERQIEKILLKYGWEKVSNWECLFVHRLKGLFLSVYVDDINFAGKKQHIDPMWKLLNKEVDLGEARSFLDHVYLGCTQRQCEMRKDIVDNYRAVFESRISAGATEKLQCSEKKYCHVGNTAQNAVWDCFKTPILQEILRIQNLHQVEHCALLEVIRSFQSFGCARNKLQFHTVQQNQKSFSRTQD